MANERILVVDDSPTILRVVELVLAKAGYQVSTAADGEAGLAAAKDQRPDLILLDFVMPKMNGFQMCKELSQIDALRDVPVVLMSAKGDQLGDHFVQVMRIVDFITKPFSPEAITAVVSHTLAKYRTPAAEELPMLPGPAQDITTTINERLADPRLDTVSNAVVDEAVETLDERSAALAGDLKVVPLAQVLELLERQIQTGLLTVARPGARVEVCFRDGKVDLARATGVSEEFLLGRFLVRSKFLSKEALDSFFLTRTNSGALMGGQLVRQGLLAKSDLEQVLGEQTRELIYELLRWNFGRFAFVATRDLPAAAIEAALGLQVDGVLMEGFRRVDEWHLIEREISNFDLIFLRNEEAVSQMGKGKLTREELAALELVNGKNNVREIVRQSRMSSFDVSKMLYRLLLIRLIRKRVLPIAV